MAFFPCDVGPHKNPGRNMNMYIGLLSDRDPLRYGLRLCQGHWGEIEPHLAEYEVLIDNATNTAWGTTSWCATCGEPIEESGGQVFVTCYPSKNDRKDYWLQVHSSCPIPKFLPPQTKVRHE